MLEWLEQRLRHLYGAVVDENDAFDQRMIEADQRLLELDQRIGRVKQRAGLGADARNGESA